MERAYVCCWCGKLFHKQEERDSHAEQCEMKTKCAKCGCQVPIGVNMCITCQIDYESKLKSQIKIGEYMNENWIRLTEKNIEEAIECAGISFLEKNNDTGLLSVPNDRWYLDFELLVGKTRICGICISIWHESNPPYKEYTLHIHPSTICPKTMETYVGVTKPKNDDEAVKLLKGMLETALTHIAKRGIRWIEYSYPIGDGEYEGGSDWVLGGSSPLYFKIQPSRKEKGFRSILN